MSKYRIANVQFSADGKPYPVNCKFSVQAGDFVIVRLCGKYTPLQKARVVSTDFWKGECKHSVVCRSEDAEAYGGGPDTITTGEKLDLFLTRFLKMTKIPVVERRSFASKPKPHKRWWTAYLLRSNPYLPMREVDTARKIVVAGKVEIMYSAPDDGQMIKLLDNALLLDDSLLSHGLAWRNDRFPMEVEMYRKKDKSVYENVYQYIAHCAEEPLAVDVYPTDFRTAEINAVMRGE